MRRICRSVKLKMVRRGHANSSTVSSLRTGVLYTTHRKRKWKARHQLYNHHRRCALLLRGASKWACPAVPRHALWKLTSPSPAVCHARGDTSKRACPKVLRKMNSELYNRHQRCALLMRSTGMRACPMVHRHALETRKTWKNENEKWRLRWKVESKTKTWLVLACGTRK